MIIPVRCFTCGKVRRGKGEETKEEGEERWGAGRGTRKCTSRETRRRGRSGGAVGGGEAAAAVAPAEHEKAQDEGIMAARPV